MHPFQCLTKTMMMPTFHIPFLSKPENKESNLFHFQKFHQQLNKNKQASKSKKSMYPKVKVREQLTHDHKIISLLSLKDIQSLATHDSSSPVKEYQDVSPSSVVRIPKDYVPNVVMPMVSVSEGAEKNNKQIDDEDRPNIRASSIPRPRAVLSSPDNDAVIGHKNRIKAERPSALKNNNSIPNRHAQCKILPSDIATESPTNTRKPKDSAEKKNDLNGKKGSVITVTSQRRNVRTGKASSVRI